MIDLFNLSPEEGLALGLVILLGVWALYRLLIPPAKPAVALTVDQPSLGGVGTFRSTRYRLSGRPDELRRSSSGEIVPVEVKSANSPRSGIPYPSHRVQLLAYILLVEETYGSPPPFGVLSYGDGVEIRVSWNRDARGELLNVLSEWRQPYQGATDPSPAKCRACQFAPVCTGATSVGAAG